MTLRRLASLCEDLTASRRATSGFDDEEPPSDTEEKTGADDSSSGRKRGSVDSDDAPLVVRVSPSDDVSPEKVVVQVQDTLRRLVGLCVKAAVVPSIPDSLASGEKPTDVDTTADPLFFASTLHHARTVVDLEVQGSLR